MVFEFNIRTFETEEFIEITPYVYRAVEEVVWTVVCVMFLSPTQQLG